MPPGGHVKDATIFDDMAGFVKDTAWDAPWGSMPG
jgi:hypothetical protein